MQGSHIYTGICTQVDVGHGRVKAQMYAHTRIRPGFNNSSGELLKTESQIQTLSILHPTGVLNIPHWLKIKVNTL